MTRLHRLLVFLPAALSLPHSGGGALVSLRTVNGAVSISESR